MVNSRTGLNSPALAPPFDRLSGSAVHSVSNVEFIIDEQREGIYKRRMLRWRTPQLGWIKMFINPSNINITEGKDIESTRTKAGFILQYAGEKLTQIGIRGTTGSAGIEGINILRTIYRSEQVAFEQIANELERAAPVAEALQLAQGQLDATFDPAGGADFLADAIDIALNIFQQPFPTLASLAANVELFFQGILYRGYFTEFTVEENGESPGLFTYNLTFVAHSQQGIRRNFMPWHRQPFSPIGAAGQDPNPLSYRPTGDTPNAPTNYSGGETFPNQVVTNALDVIRGRSTSSASGRDGRSLTDENLEDDL